MVIALVVVAGSFVAGRALALVGDPSSSEFTGVVTQFADDGALMCVRRNEPEGSRPFCDVYYVPPGTPQIEVGDRVVVRTISSRGDDGSPVSGLLVTPLP